MRKITNKSPNRLIDMEFNIPLFNAQNQMYVCTNVKEVKTTPGGKDYNISLSEVKRGYSVPENIEVDLFIPTDGGALAQVKMLEIRKGAFTQLGKIIIDKAALSTLEGLKKVFREIVKDF